MRAQDSGRFEPSRARRTAPLARLPISTSSAISAAVETSEASLSSRSRTRRGNRMEKSVPLTCRSRQR